MSVYLDYNASGLVRPEVQDVMARALADNGNPSAVHAAGRRARARVETARAQVADLVGADPTAVVFNSGGTEANQLALAQAAGPIIVSAIEHASILEAVPDAIRSTLFSSAGAQRSMSNITQRHRPPACRGR